MVDFDKVPQPTESDRAPPGVCELSLQAYTNQATNYQSEYQRLLNDYVEQTIDVKAFEYDGNQSADRLSVYTGTDRLDLATLRDMVEIYAQVSEFPEGNIPPNISLVPTTEEDTDKTVFAWLEFQLEREQPEDEVQWMLQKAGSDLNIYGKTPIGDKGESILFRNGNVSHHQVRDVINKATIIRDVLPVEYVRIVCEVSE